MARTKIEWAEYVWNPVTGCTPASEGCKNCYAKRFWSRLKKNRKLQRYNRPFSEVMCHQDRLGIRFPRKPKIIFVNSMGDLFHSKVESSFIGEVFKKIAKNNHHVFICLTKRPENISKALEVYGRKNIKNLWLGISAEDQKTAEQRIELLFDSGWEGKKLISLEPLIAPIDLNRIDKAKNVNWIITGGETGGYKARPMRQEWALAVKKFCNENQIPFFHKQNGEFVWEPKEYIIKNGTIKHIIFHYRWVGRKKAGCALNGKIFREYPVFKQ